LKNIIYISVVDISEKNGQGIYALKILQSFINQNYVNNLYIILPEPRDLGVLNTYLENLNINFVFLSKKTQNRSITWHLKVQMQLLIKLFKFGKNSVLVYSMKPMMFAPIVYSKLSESDIYLLVEGLAKNTVKEITNSFFSKFGQLILKWNIINAKKIYPAYIEAKKWIDSISSNKSKIINCGVDLKIFIPIQKETTTKLTLGYVGSFDKRHILKELIKAVQSYNVNVMLVGDGYQKQYLENYVLENNLTNIYFLGKKDQKELAQFFSKCDVMWAGTHEENWSVPIKCFEYLACNKKVIVTQKDDFKFIEDYNYGYILQDTSVKTIQNLMLQVVKDYKNGSLKDNDDSRSYIMKNNDWNNFAKTILKDIEDDSRS